MIGMVQQWRTIKEVHMNFANKELAATSLHQHPKSIECTELVRLSTEVSGISFLAGNLDRNAPRFADALKKAWRILTKTNIADALSKHWQELRDRETEKVKAVKKVYNLEVQPEIFPYIILLPDIKSLGYGRVARHRRGAEFCFSSPYLTEMPDELIVAIIGHELIHGHRWIAKSRLNDTKAEEEMVMQITQDNGFDQEGLQRHFGRRSISEQSHPQD